MNYLRSRKKETIVPAGDYRLANDISGLWKPLKITISNREYFNALIQWDDGWLLSIMKQYFYLEGYKTENKLKYELEELLSNKKQFYSIVKDANHFIRMDKKIVENIHIDFKKLKEYGIGLNSYFNHLVCNIEEKCKDKDNMKKGSFLFNVKMLIEAFFADVCDFNSIMQEIINDFFTTECKDKVEHYFIEFKSPNYGLANMPYIVIDGDVKILDEVSNIHSMLQSDGLNFPVVHIYIKKKEEFKYSEFIDRLARYIAVELNNFFENVTN
ncbi:hypothetical protein B0P06_002868 [Clostridium saccharoperbutylacetonicum]|nr:hypothetical protein [Clostridium saccharoperbutylacetonicum]NRT60410.1 hypothetical protein [Clostridium saccharoperbutylacetonicum]NSB23723.1 hypothetical protein [Clostridium saccharoperbutylacetonicum]NSB43097.1 hypothetical protein [Clostridium saccharoperbutylacetonicum]